MKLCVKFYDDDDNNDARLTAISLDKLSKPEPECLHSGFLLGAKDDGGISTPGRNASQQNKEEATDLVWPCCKNGRKTTATKSNALPYRRVSECRQTAK